MSSFYTNDIESSDTIKYDYDLIVIGGGSGGLSCSKAAAKYGKNVCVLDYVKPSLHGSTWGLGGTCVNVGCMPKKQFHYASLLHEIITKDAHMYGYFDSNQKNLKPTFIWSNLVESVQNQIRSSNFKYRVELRSNNIKYENYLGTFIDSHTLELTNQNREPKRITGRRFVIAVGGRPQQLECNGGQYAITSDDIFSLKNPPGKTLVIGGSYVALECAGFLAGLGYSTTIMVRSILLRGFDQEMANKIGDYMETECNVKILQHCIPYSIERLENGKYKVQWCSSGGKRIFSNMLKSADIVGEDIYDTILNATGRYADVQHLGISSIGVKINPVTGHILAEKEQTSVPHIYAVGDVVDGVPELTPPAILAGKLLAERLYNNGHQIMNYTNIPTTIFTPIEYGCVGLTEDDSHKQYGEKNVTVYHQYFTPLEWSLSQERKLASKCYIKVLCLKNENNKMIGFHYLGPNAGEVTQGVAVAIKLNVTYQQLVDTVGIHPTTAEIMTLINITKESGDDPNPKGCCG